MFVIIPLTRRTTTLLGVTANREHQLHYHISTKPALGNLLQHYWETERERERNMLFNDALNTFYLWLYGVRHMVKDHSDSEKGNPLPPHRLLID